MTKNSNTSSIKMPRDRCQEKIVLKEITPQMKEGKITVLEIKTKDGNLIVEGMIQKGNFIVFEEKTAKDIYPPETEVVGIIKMPN